MSASESRQCLLGLAGYSYYTRGIERPGLGRLDVLNTFPTLPAHVAGF